MPGSSTSVDGWAVVESERVKVWQTSAAERIRLAVRDLQEKLRQAGRSKARAIAGILAQRACLRLSIEEHDAHIAEFNDEGLALRKSERHEFLRQLQSSEVRPFSPGLSSRWSRLAELDELDAAKFLPPGDESKDDPSAAVDDDDDAPPSPLYLPPAAAEVVAATSRKLEHCRDSLPFHGPLAALTGCAFKPPQRREYSWSYGGNFVLLSGDRLLTTGPMRLRDAAGLTTTVPAADQVLFGAAPVPAADQVVFGAADSFEHNERFEFAIELPRNRVLTLALSFISVYDLASGCAIQQFWYPGMFRHDRATRVAYADGHILLTSKVGSRDSVKRRLSYWREGLDGMVRTVFLRDMYVLF